MNDLQPKRGGTRWLWLIAVLIIGGFGLYAEFTVHWSYSDGERVGILQKMSREGWICKTHEGELALYIVSGVAPQLWNFTVRDDEIVQQLNSRLGQRVRLHYTEHRGVPTGCFGNTEYYVDQVLPVGQ